MKAIWNGAILAESEQTILASRLHIDLRNCLNSSRRAAESPEVPEWRVRRLCFRPFSAFLCALCTSA